MAAVRSRGGAAEPVSMSDTARRKYRREGEERRRQDLIEATLEKIRKRPAAFPAVLSTSSEKGDGLEELRAAIALAASGG